MTTLDAADTRIPRDDFDSVVSARKRVCIQHKTAGRAYLVSEADVQLLEAVEDALDVRAAEEALTEMKGKKPIPWEQIKARLRL